MQDLRPPLVLPVVLERKEGQVSGSGEAGHVRADLSDQTFSGAAVDSGDINSLTAASKELTLIVVSSADPSSSFQGARP
jgi:hypothetical protein